MDTVDTVAEEAPGADSIALKPESQISITCEASPNQQEIERRRPRWRPHASGGGLFFGRMIRRSTHATGRPFFQCIERRGYEIGP